jgi:archaetidylinositol phosphate synthase
LFTRLREALSPALEALGSGLGRLVPYPNFWTTLGLAFSLLAAFLFAIGRFRLAGVFVLASGFMDIVDGSVARATNKVTPRGGFLDSNIDRVAESVLYLGLVLSPQVGGLAAASALATSLLVSYSRAKAEAAGLKAEGVGIGERAERLVVLAVGSLLGFTYYSVIIVTLISIATFVQRLYVYGSRL